MSPIEAFSGTFRNLSRKTSSPGLTFAATAW
jgi:hypothetical protein